MDVSGMKGAGVKLGCLFFLVIENCGNAKELPNLTISYDACVSNGLADISETHLNINHYLSSANSNANKWAKSCTMDSWSATVVDFFASTTRKIWFPGARRFVESPS